MGRDTGDAWKTSSEDFYARRLANYAGLLQWQAETRAQRAVEALQKNGFTAVFVKDREEARARILNLVPPGAAVGVGGSITIRQIGVLTELQQSGCVVHDHWAEGISFEETMRVRRAHLNCDVFLTSANAITQDGQIVSCDGVGNRVGAMIFGPGRVVIVAGTNKLVKDLPEAMKRVKEVAAPPTLKELGLSLPCTETGICNDCRSESRGCRVTVILERRPALTDTTVLLVGEALGF